MRHHYLVTMALAALLGAALLGGCEELGAGGDGGSRSDGGINPNPGACSLVTPKQAGESATASFAAGSEEYLVVPYSVSETAATGIEYTVTIKSGSSTGSGTFMLQRPPLPGLQQRDPALWARWQKRLSVERWARGLAEKAVPGTIRAANNTRQMMFAGACTTSSECSADQVCHNGSCTGMVEVKVGTFASSATINADVKKKGTIAAILVDQADTVSQANIDALLDKFETVIYPRDAALFGNPLLADGGATLAADRNADGLIWLVLTSKTKQKDDAAGFFVGTDFDDTDAKSNKADILYIDASLSDLTKGYTTLAHELQHLLNYSSKVYKGKGGLEALWLDEGQAHFAEDACGYGGENVGLLDQEVFTSFKDTAVFSTNDSLAMRGMAFMFVRYLFEQKGGVTYNSDGTITDKGGAALLTKFHTTSKQGTAAVDEAYGDHKTAMDNWMGAIALDNRSVTSDGACVFQSLVADPVTQNQIGLKIRNTTRKDDEGKDVELKGPNETSIEASQSSVEDAIANATGNFFLLKGRSGNVQISVAPKDTSEQGFRFAVIKLK